MKKQTISTSGIYDRIRLEIARLGGHGHATNAAIDQEAIRLSPNANLKDALIIYLNKLKQNVCYMPSGIHSVFL